MHRFFREPLVHFLLLGGALFAFSYLKGGGEEAAGEAAAAADVSGGERAVSKEIVVSRGQIESIGARFAKVWQRPPSPQELRGLVDDYVRDEVMYREALKLGLDRGDEMVRRRMRQKLEFFTEDIAALAEPSEEQLGRFLASNPDAFRLDAEFTFRQVYFNPENHSDNLEADIESQLAALRAAGGAVDIREAGDRSLLRQEFQKVSEREVAGQFGKAFLIALLELKTGSWEGPVRSGFGQHLVFISERLDGRVPPLEEVRDEVARDWAAARREESSEALYQKWLAGYSVTVEELAEDGGAGQGEAAE